jgi:drug/metabolite transporter (DMT)-like permease
MAVTPTIPPPPPIRSHRPPHALLRPEIALPFLLVALVWGSTWLVIKDQLAAAPPSWSVTYRFAIAAVGMCALALFRRESLRLTAGGHLFAVAIGFTQFFVNHNFVYRAELHLTSGIVAVLFGLLLLPNAILGRIFLGQQVTPRFFIGGLIGLAGIAALLVNEARNAPVGGDVALGILYTVIAILGCSCANVAQATEQAQRVPVVSLLAWAMAWGTLIDAPVAWAVAGPPVLPVSLRYWSGVVYLGLIGSVFAFPLYYTLVRKLGAGRAAYNSVVVPVVAMALSTVFENYRWSALALAGGALALGGMVIALRARHPVK